MEAPDLRDRVLAMEKATKGQWSRIPKDNGTVSVSIRLPEGDTIFGHGADTKAAMDHLEKRYAAFSKENA